jgi:hypothetical protein
MMVDIPIRAQLLERAKKLSGQDEATKVVELALEEMIKRRAKLEALLDIAGTVEFYDGYDYKALRAGTHDRNP